MSSNEDVYVSLSLKKVFAGLSVIMLLIMGGGLSIVILDMMFNIADRIGMASILFPSLCALALISASYHQFVEFYYHLQTNRRQARRELKAVITR